MVLLQVMFVVIGHRVRRKQALILAGSIGATLMIDADGYGANWNRRRTLEWATNQSYRMAVLEGDAMSAAGFCEKIAVWLAHYPNALCSLYLGTGRPPQYQLGIVSKLIAANKVRADFITLSRLIHGVRYSIPQQHTERVLGKWNHGKAADYAVGDAHGGPAVYPCYLLADHAGGQSIEQARDNQPRTERREAWRLNI